MLFVAFAACENNRKVVCNDCVSDPNGNCKLIIHLSLIGDNHSNIPVKIYEGPVENNNLLFETSMYLDYGEFTVMPDKEYTVTASYNIGGKKYIAVDSTRPKIMYDDSSCDVPCYYVYDNEINLRLKYTK
jgi:hypothetical protein